MFPTDWIQTMRWRIHHLLHTYRSRLPLLGVWLGLLSHFYIAISTSPFTLNEVAILIFDTMTTVWWAPLLFLGAYLIRTFLFFPLSFFGLASGLFFGIGYGILIAFVGAFISACVAYAVGLWIHGNQNTEAIQIAPGLASTLLDTKPFEVVLGTHLTFMPFDLVNYVSGLLRIHLPSFGAAVLVGSIPGTLSFVSLGASIDFEQFISGGFSVTMFDWRYLLISLAVFIISLIGAHIWRQYLRHRI